MTPHSLKWKHSIYLLCFTDFSWWSQKCESLTENRLVKIWHENICPVDVTTYYVFNLNICPGTQPSGPYSHSKKPNDTVKRLVSPIFQTNQNVTLDNWCYNWFPIDATFANRAQVHKHRHFIQKQSRNSKWDAEILANFFLDNASRFENSHFEIFKPEHLKK